MITSRFAAWAARGLLLGTVLGCGAMYPEVRAPVRKPPTTWTPEPPPPEEVVYLEFVEARIPKRTRDGRDWGTRGPESFGKIVVDGRDILVTPIASGSFQPTWPDQRRANYRIAQGAEVRIEIWDARAIKNRPICLKRLGSLHAVIAPAPVEFVCEETGARMLVNIAPGRALLGLGLYYELLGSGGIQVTRVVEESPASRAGIARGTRILTLQGRSVQELDALDIKSLINANSRTGVQMDLLFPDGKRQSVSLKEEAMYPLVHEPLSLEP